MKKKLLSLMMAATMVATGTVSAFAAPNVTGPDAEVDGTSKEYKTEVEITGNVANEKGQYKPGTLQVTVPTAANFSVDKDGKFLGTSLNIKNDGLQTIEVFVDEFIDVNGNDGIELVGESLLSNKPRTSVNLRLEGNLDIAYLGNKGADDKGVFSDKELATKEVKGLKIADIQANAERSIELKGEAGSNNGQVDTAVQDKFTLKLMIKKAQPAVVPGP